MTEQQALLKLTTLCTQAEHCSQEMIDKMKKWELPEDAIARNMEFLTEKKFIDDERFARFFINDKIKYNKWGRRKVEQALWMKHIPKDISDPIFEEIEDDLYMETLLPLMKNKYKTIKAKNDYERSMKLIRFALGRGYSMEVIHKMHRPDEGRRSGRHRFRRGILKQSIKFNIQTSKLRVKPCVPAC